MDSNFLFINLLLDTSTDLVFVPRKGGPGTQSHLLGRYTMTWNEVLHNANSYANLNVLNVSLYNSTFFYKFD